MCVCDLTTPCVPFPDNNSFCIFNLKANSSEMDDSNLTNTMFGVTFLQDLSCPNAIPPPK